jgi:Zn-dependent protease with chaperone function
MLAQQVWLDKPKPYKIISSGSGKPINIMAQTKPLVDVRKNIRTSLFKAFIVPLLVLAFFIAAPSWLNYRLHAAATKAIENNPNHSPAEREERLTKIATIDFQQVCLDCPPGLEKMHDNLAANGIVANFQRLRWALYLSAGLVGGLFAALLAISVLNRRAGGTPEALIGSYRLAWTVGVSAALLEVLLMIPLLTYGTFEFTVLLFDQYVPKLLLLIILGGVFALWRSIAILLKTIPLQFKEPMSREVTPADAPELWEKVRAAVTRLQTAPPDRIIIGLQLNFYVTELAVLHDHGKAEGRTLFLSYPLLKALPEDEVLAIIGHELGHFMGNDTRMTREFYPLRLKIRGTLMAMAQSGWVGWPSFQFLSYFHWCFSETEQTASREREFLADQRAASLTSARTAALALLRFQVLAEAFQRNLKAAVQNNAPNPLQMSLQPVVREQLAPDAAFWTELFEKHLPHPLDSHPPLRARLTALGQNISGDEARSIALAEADCAYDRWLAGRDELFTGLASQAEAAVTKLRTRSQITGADFNTEAGKELLNRHFPEIIWTTKPSNFWAGVITLALLVGGCIAAVIFISDPAARVIFILIGALIGTFIWGIWQRHRGAVLTLNAGGIFYSGWKRPLLFKEVANLSARRNYSNVTLNFHLKEKQPPIWKSSLLPIARKQLGFSLSGFNQKPLVMAQTIFRYLTRQTQEETPKASDHA